MASLIFEDRAGMALIDGRASTLRRDGQGLPPIVLERTEQSVEVVVGGAELIA
jgi:hypothetical protein